MRSTFDKTTDLILIWLMWFSQILMLLLSNPHALWIERILQLFIALVYARVCWCISRAVLDGRLHF